MKSKLKKNIFLWELILFLKAALEERKVSRLYKGLAPTVELSEFFPIEAPSLHVHCPSTHLYNPYLKSSQEVQLSLKEITVICHLVKHLNPQKILEIGTANFGSATLMALNSSEQASIDTLDIHTPSVSPTSKKISSHLGSSKNWRPSEKNKYDFIFIDGDHSFEWVVEDLKLALEFMVRPSGVILLHDLHPKFEGVARALEFYKNQFNFYRIRKTKLAIAFLNDLNKKAEGI